MKKLTLFILLAVAVSGCQKNMSEDVKPKPKPTKPPETPICNVCEVGTYQ